MIYLDNAATTFPKPKEVYKAADEAIRNYTFNSGRGSYKKAKEISEIIKETRSQIADLVDIENENKVIFTPSATYALNQIIFGLEYEKKDNIYITPFEHNSIIRPLKCMQEKYNLNIITIPFNKETWELETDNLKELFEKKKPKYIFMSTVSNVTGYIIPIEQILKLSSKFKSINILDASQSFGIVPINFKNLNIDALVFAGHKSLHGPFGIAGFIKNTDFKLASTISGGTGSDTLNQHMPDDMPTKYEAGSPNSTAIFILLNSIKWLKKVDVLKKKKELTKYLIEKLEQLINVTLYLPKNREKCEGIVSINIDGYTPDEVGTVLDNEFDIAVRTGYHCAPFVHDFIDSKDRAGTVRISLGYFTTKEEIDKLISAIESL
ncbi:MAG: aminotransferase class V-fold PLP-dependent enzyme [Clostridia bacterium]